MGPSMAISIREAKGHGGDCARALPQLIPSIPTQSPQGHGGPSEATESKRRSHELSAHTVKLLPRKAGAIFLRRAA